MSSSRMTVALRALGMLGLISLFGVADATAEDVFRLSAPPGAIYGNASFEQTTLVAVDVAIEHQGEAIPDWFLSATAGGGTYTHREASRTDPNAEISYQLYPVNPDGETPVLASPSFSGFSGANVITGPPFTESPGTSVIQVYTIYFRIPQEQFKPSGTYSDTFELRLYQGTPGDPNTHTLRSHATVNVTIRMARLVDLFAVQEPGIRTMDLTRQVTDRLLAVVHERSNADTGYEVRITSANLAAAPAGTTTPFLAQNNGTATLDYSLRYGGAPALPWTNGTVVVTDSAETTATAGSPYWITRDLEISYNGSPSLAAGDYEDRLIITIVAQ